jgi:hypothetical protein
MIFKKEECHSCHAVHCNFDTLPCTKFLRKLTKWVPIYSRFSRWPPGNTDGSLKVGDPTKGIDIFNRDALALVDTMW